jgi:hypothetical protein
MRRKESAPEMEHTYITPKGSNNAMQIFTMTFNVNDSCIAAVGCLG